MSKDVIRPTHGTDVNRANLPASDSNDDPSVAPDAEVITGPPRWVQVFAIVVLVLVLLFAMLHLIGGGPGRHMPGGTDGHRAPSTSTVRGGHQP